MTGLSGSTDTAESMATMSMAMLAGSAVMQLTVIWGSCVFFGNYDISDSSTSSALENNKKPFSLTGFFSCSATFMVKHKGCIECNKLMLFSLCVHAGYGVRTDDATRYTARIMILSMIPFLILQLAKLINSSSGIRVVILISLLVTLVFLFLYCFYQVNINLVAQNFPPIDVSIYVGKVLLVHI